MKPGRSRLSIPAPTEYVLLTRALRGILRARKIRYVEVAEGLGMAVSSVKRILTASDGSVGRLAEICALAGVSFADLVASAHEREEALWRLTPAQEEFFLEHPDHFEVFALLAVRKKSVEEAREITGLSARGMRRYLEDLEARELIEITGRREVRLMGRGGLAFQPGSALLRSLQGRFGRRLVAWLTREGGRPDGETLHTREWRASAPTAARFARDLADLVAQMERVSNREEALLPAEELELVTFLAGLARGDLPGARVPEPGARR